MASPDAQDKELWGPKRERIFIDILVNEVNKGTINRGSISKTVWDHIQKETNKCTNKKYTLKQMKQKFERLRVKHRVLHRVLTNTVNAYEETMQNFMRVHKEAAHFIENSEHYRLLEIIFDEPTTTTILHSSEKKRKTKSRKESKTNQMDEAVMASVETSRARATTEASLLRADKYRIGREKSEEVASSNTETGFTIAQCIDALNEIEGLDDKTIVTGLTSFKDPDNRVIFMTIPVRMKKAWLKFLM